MAVDTGPIHFEMQSRSLDALIEPGLALFLDRRLEREPRLAVSLDRRVDVQSCLPRFPLSQIVRQAGRAAVGLISLRRIVSPRGRTVVCS